MSRRASGTKAVPYQVMCESVNTGKNLGSTKRKVRWRFGWSNEDGGEHDIEFVHSMMSGKRVNFSCDVLFLFASVKIIQFLSVLISLFSFFLPPLLLIHCFKQTLLEDGREIISTTNLMSREFSHGWNSNGHILRVEVCSQGLLFNPLSSISFQRLLV